MDQHQECKKVKRQVVTQLVVTMNDGYNRSARKERQQDGAVRIVGAGIKALSPHAVKSVHVSTYTAQD